MKPLPEAMIEALENERRHNNEKVLSIAEKRTRELAVVLRALLERGPTERMKKACGVYEAVAADVLRAQLTQLIAELEEK